jgi:dsRNA-specific ribonuclease
MLQEKLQAQKLGTPVYRVTKTEGMPHARTFSVEAVWQNGRAEGQGASIKSAEMMAARLALETINDGTKKSKVKQAKAHRRIADQKNE